MTAVKIGVRMRVSTRMRVRMRVRARVMVRMRVRMQVISHLQHQHEARITDLPGSPPAYIGGGVMSLYHPRFKA